MNETELAVANEALEDLEGTFEKLGVEAKIEDVLVSFDKGLLSLRFALTAPEAEDEGDEDDEED